MTEWVYLVNDRSPEWGYDVSSVEFFKGTTHEGMHAWTLPRVLKAFEPGDFIWVRATSPLSAFVGLGQVATELKPDPDGAVFGVVFDPTLCRLMAANPIEGVLEKHTQTPRRLTEGELRELHRRAGSLPKDPPLPAGRITRLQEVLARQGQAVFRAKLMVAYEGRCAFSRTAVPEVLQAAHIEPYSRRPSNDLQNGLLLRADIHDLFDRGLLWVTDGLRVGVAKPLRGSEYEALRGKRIHVPADRSLHPDVRRFALHRTQIAGQSQ